eukprot:Gb_36905 [translate_table: standard]
MEVQQKCLYEILGVERTSTPDEIRSAYRKLALKLHPDKLVQTGVSLEQATARFQEVQRAYEVLSDARERAWYDSHRSQILYSPASSSSANKSDFDLNLWPYFSTSIYSGYGETGKGFYKVYAEVFQKLFQQEVACAHAMGGAPVTEAPLMGSLESPYPQVSAFYNYWLGFCTVKDFSWVDEYHASAGPNRKARRLMEEENKKLRRKARREYNEQVRQLAEFVKKRDKRVLERQLEKSREQKEKEVRLKLRREQLVKEKLEKARLYEEEAWTKLAESEEEESQGNGGGNDDDWYDSKVTKESESSQQAANQELYCIVCSKKFKSDKQWKNHEQSKKHKDKVLELRDSFVEEDNLVYGFGKGIDEELDSNAPGNSHGLDSNAPQNSLGLDEELDSRTQVENLIEQYNRALVDDREIGDELNVRAEVDDLCDLGDDTLGLKENGIGTENGVARDSSILNEAKDQVGSSSGVEHYGDPNDVSDKSSYQSIDEDEKADRENYVEVHSNDGEHESDNGHMDDEASLLEAMLKTHRTKQVVSNAYQAGAAVREADNTNCDPRMNTGEAGSRKQKNGNQSGFVLTDLVLSDTEDGTEISFGKAIQRQGSKKAGKQKRKQTVGIAEQSVSDNGHQVDSRSEDNLGVEQHGAESSFLVNGKTDTLEGGQAKKHLKKTAKQSADRKSAATSSTAKEMSTKGKRQAKSKKGKSAPKFAGNTCETCGEDFDSRNQLFLHISGTGHAMLKAR